MVQSTLTATDLMQGGIGEQDGWGGLGHLVVISFLFVLDPTPLNVLAA